MKKFLLITILCLGMNALNAQFYSRYYIMNAGQNSWSRGVAAQDKNYVKNNISKVITKKFDKKTNQYIPIYASFNNKFGAIYQYQNFNKKGVVNRIWEYQMFDSMRYNKFLSIYKKDTFTVTYQFNKNLMVEKESNYSKDKVLYNSNNFTYNDSNKLTSYNSLNKKGKETYRYEYEYHENGTRKMTKYYRKNKLKEIWNYACVPTGELEKKITQTNICKKRNYNPDSSYVEIYEGNDNKGHNYRQVSIYSKDSLIQEYTYYNQKNKEINKYVYTYNNKKIESSKFYKKGNLKYTNFDTYAANNLVVSWRRVMANGKEVYNYKHEFISF